MKGSFEKKMIKPNKNSFLAEIRGTIGTHAIVIGASAGGLKAIGCILSALPA